MKLSILILTYNRLSVTSSCIPAIINAAEGIDKEILVWDNGSVDGTFDWLLEYQKIDPRLTHVHSSDQNHGMEAINYMADRAKGDFILKIDDDIIPPPYFAKKMVDAFVLINEPKLAYLSYDMRWGKSTFATRSGMKMYSKSTGKVVRLPSGEKVFIHFHPDKWMANGACRLSKKSTFLKLGGHPAGVKYGVDFPVSKAAAKAGMWIGYLNSSRNVEHVSGSDAPLYRQFKNVELRKAVKGK